MEKGIKKVGADTCKKVLSKVLTIVFLVTDFVTGCDQAESILGVQETSIVEEVVAGLLNALCNFLIIPSIVPGVNWIARKIYGIFDKDFEERQDEATEAYEKYVEETGSTLTKEEYLKRQHSATGKIGGWFSDRGRDIVNGVKSIGGGIKKAGETVVDGVKSAGKWIGDKASSAWDSITGLFGGHARGTISLSDVIEDNPLFKTMGLAGNWVSTKFNESVIGKTLGKIKNGNMDELESLNVNDKNPVTSVVSKITKYMLSPMSMLKSSLDGISNLIGDASDELGADDSLNKTMDKAKNRRISILSKDYWKSGDEKSDNTLAGSLKKSFNVLTKYFLPLAILTLDFVAYDNIPIFISFLEITKGLFLSSLSFIPTCSIDASFKLFIVFITPFSLLSIA